MVSTTTAKNRRKSTSDVLDMTKSTSSSGMGGSTKSRTLSLGGSYNYRTRIKSDQEPFSINLKVFDQHIGNLREVCREESDSPFTESVWEGIRHELQTVHDSHVKYQPFQQPLLEDTSVTRSVQDANYIRSLETRIRSLLLPLDTVQWAHKLHLPPKVVLTEFVYAAASGIVEMWFGPTCHGCGASTVKESSLQDIAMEQTCQNCGWQNSTETLDEIKVQFVLHEDILYLPNLLFDFPNQSKAPKMSKFCFGLYAPPTTNFTKWEYNFGIHPDEHFDNHDPHEHATWEPALAPGRYRFHCSYSRVDADIVVQRHATPNDTPIQFDFTATEQQCPGRYGLPRTVSHLEHGKVSLQLMANVASIMYPLVFYNLTDDDEKIFYHKEEHDDDPNYYTSATQCLHLACFGRLFGSQVVNDVSQFVVQRVTLVFTDVVSSTQLYSDAGDGQALNCVKEHFQVLFQAFTKHGRIVKTIGDAVMAAFTSPQPALQACLQAIDDMQHVKRPCGNSLLQVRIGVHSGPALMVCLNGTNDYFGSTVNIAARVEAKAHGGEVLVSQAVLDDDHAAKEYYEENMLGRLTRQVSLDLKGVDKPVVAKGFGPVTVEIPSPRPSLEGATSSATSSTASASVSSSHHVGDDAGGMEDAETTTSVAVPVQAARGSMGSRMAAMLEASRTRSSQQDSKLEDCEIWV